MSPSVRKLALSAHVASSVGWLGAIAVFLALAVIGLTSVDERMVRGAYLVMERAAWLVLLPLAVTSLVTGLVSSVVSRWGLFRHYWVVFKLCINVFATAVLLLYMDTFRLMAGMAANPSLRLAVVRNPSPVVHAVLAVALLLLATVLAVFKPPALTRYGWRRQHQAGTAHEPS